MQKVLMMLGAILAWTVPALAATHDGVQLWENGPLWAKTNVGANSPTEAGYYFWWGDTLGYKRQNNQWVASDGSKSGYSFSASTNGKTLDQLQAMGATGADGILLPAFDGAAKQWGDDWRIPKASEYRNLIELCTWSWTTNNSVVGYSVTGKGLYSGNSIFIPVCGYGSTTNITSNLTTIYLWTSSSDAKTSGRPCFTPTSRAVGFNTGRANGYPIRPVKSLIAAKQSAAAALDTRTGTRTVAAKESIAYDAAWGDATSGTLTVNGTAVSGLSKTGTYAWTPNTSQTNYWKLAYKAGTANYSAIFQSSTFTVKYNANGGSGSMASVTGTYGQSAKLTTNAFSRPGYAFLGWTTTPNGTTIAYKDGQSMNIPFSQSSGTLNLYAKWTDKWYVDAETGDDANEGTTDAHPFKTIQHAIDLTVPGMTIVVADGMYAPIDSGNKSITIRSVNGAAKTIIDGGKTEMCARLANWSATASMTNTVLRGFRLQNGYSSLDAGGVQGGTLHDCHVVSNRAARSGGGAHYSTLYNCVVEENSCGNQGGGSYSPTAYDCTFINNACATNGAGVCRGALNNCLVDSNRSEHGGGGVYLAYLTNCVIRSNTALTYGGGTQSSSLYECVVSNNVAWLQGGGSWGWTKIEKCLIVDNEAYQSGGGVYYTQVCDSEIRGNKATQDAGGAYNCTVVNSVLADNEAGAHGGGVLKGNLENCLVYGNRARTGSGGGVAQAISVNCTIYGNNAAVNGGGATMGTNYNCIVYGNVASAGKEINVGGLVGSVVNCYTDDPHFIRAEAGDFRLRCDSPCIDAGDKTYVTNTVDFAGNPRIVNNKVDIGAYEFSAALDQHFTVQVANGTGGAIYYEGDTVTIAAEDRSPRYTFTRWTGDVSVLKNVNSRANTFTMPTSDLAFTAEYDDLQQYLVIDLSGGTDAATYPVDYLADIPEGGWTDEYKTTKLVMRRIDPGTFTKASSSQVTLTQPYYIGVFELTQRQWELVMGTRPSAFSNSVCYATRPVEKVSYNQIRGADLGRWWPQMNAVDDVSFMGKLRAKTGRLFDLPTEAQWEYACRAGTTTDLNTGKNLAASNGVDGNMAEVGRYYYNSGRYNDSYSYDSTDELGTAKVGSYVPNAWGLYDMHGNVNEFCLDWYLAEEVSGTNDPVGPETGTQRSVRGGSWGNYSTWCKSSARGLNLAPNSVDATRGFRLVINFANFSLNQVVNLQASNGTEPNGVRLTWTAVPGATEYIVYNSVTENFADAQRNSNVITTNMCLSAVNDTDTHWYWVQAVVDGTPGMISEVATGYRVLYSLTVSGGEGSTNCLGNTSVTITAAAAPMGYSFKEWTGAAADVALLANKAAASTTITMPGRAVTLTATYQPNGYTVKFSPNKGEGEVVSQDFTYDLVKALAANAFMRTGYTYQGWATSASGSAAYSDKQVVSNLTATANGTVNLYAVWQANAYTVTFNANGGTGTMANESFTYDTAKALTANAFTRTGYTYQGWATSERGEVVYADNETVSNLTATANGTVNLYAAWTANPYTVTFDANGGEGSAMGAQDFAYGTAQNLPNVGYARTGYTFLGWSTNPKATDATYVDGASVSNLATGGSLKLYAVWRPNTYTVRFLPNGAEGTMADQTLTYDTAANLVANAFTKAGFGFIGWCASDEILVSFTNCQEVVNLTMDDGAVVMLTAKWVDRWYVDAATGDDANEGTDAAYPFKTIQQAIDRAESGQTIIVADGTYGAICSAGKAITIRSVNGVANTVIDGEGKAIAANLMGESEAGGARTTVLRGFTVRNGESAQDGGGVLGGTLVGCRIVSNRAARNGGGAAFATLDNCVVTDNMARGGNGGGLYDCLADNCTIVGNRASENGGGTYARGAEIVHNNCIVFGNTATREANISASVTKRSCFTGDPMFVDAENGDFRLQGASPCVDMGNNRYVAGETDIRGNARIQNGVVDIGAYEFTLPTALGDVPVEGTDAAVPIEWLGQYGYVDEDATPATLQAVLKQKGDNGVPLWESWVAGFDPWDPDSQLTAEIQMVDGEPVVSWSPDMSAAEPKRHYTVMGKTNLTDAAWIIPVNEAHRFFKVRVTMGEPGRVTEVAATAGTSADGVTLSWRAADGALGYNVYRATVDDFDRATLVASVSDAAYVDTSAVPGVEYHYWIVSVANGGEWLTSEGATGHRNIGVPQQVVASDGTATDWITVTWEAVEGAVAYRVLRATADDVAAAVAVGTSAGTSWMDREAECGTVYTYWVVAVGANITGEASASDEGYLRLPAPTDVTASNGAFGDWVRIAWAEVPAASHYRVYRSSAASGSKTPIGGWQTARTYSDTTAEAGKTYYYFVAAALDAEGLNASAYSTGVVGSLKVGTPTGVYATDGTSSTGVTVSWQAVVGADGYTVYRGTANDPTAAQILTTTSTTSFEDTTAEPGTLYFYWVAATNAVSAGEKSAGETGFRSLGAPTGVTATTKSGAAAVTVSWQPVAGAVSYRVFRGTRSGEAYAVEIDATTETSYADESVAAGRTYYYSVIAVGATCESGFSAFAAGSR